MRIVAIVGLLVSLALGCRSEQRQGPGATGAPRTLAAASQPSKASIRAALLSVYFHAQSDRAAAAPVEMQPIDLAAAAEVLRAATDPMAEARRRRAIVRLTVAGLDDADRCRAVQTLYGQPIGSLVDILNSLPLPAGHLADAAPTPPPVGYACPLSIGPLIPQNLAMTTLAAQLTASLGPAIKDCTYTYKPAVVTYDSATSTTTVVADAVVERDLAGVRKAMDPQQWDACNVFFEHTYIAKKNGSGFDVDPNYDVPADPNPPAAGSAYEGVLFEDFVVSANTIVTAWYKNLLTVSSQPLPIDSSNPTGGHVFTYELLQSLASYIYPSKIAGGLDIDDGKIAMHPSASGTSTALHATKSLRFSGRWNDEFLNQSAGVYLKAMGEGLPEMACCQP